MTGSDVASVLIILVEVEVEVWAVDCDTCDVCDSYELSFSVPV